MKNFLANPYVARLGGALMAGLTVFAFQHDAKAAVVAGATFIVYGATHSTTTTVGNS